jgi:hypothetical protein
MDPITESMLATAVLSLLHIPPVAVSVKVECAPTHRCNVPVIWACARPENPKTKKIVDSPFLIMLISNAKLLFSNG